MTDLNSTILALQLDQGVRTVHVKFWNRAMPQHVAERMGRSTAQEGSWTEKDYTYKVEPHLYETLEVGSLVVVQAAEFFQVAKVVNLDAEVDFGNEQMVRLLRWVIADVSESIEHGKDLASKEVAARRSLTNARLRAEARALLEGVNTEGVDLGLLTANVQAAEDTKAS